MITKTKRVWAAIKLTALVGLIWTSSACAHDVPGHPPPYSAKSQLANDYAWFHPWATAIDRAPASVAPMSRDAALSSDQSRSGATDRKTIASQTRPEHRSTPWPLAIDSVIATRAVSQLSPATTDDSTAWIALTLGLMLGLTLTYGIERWRARHLDKLGTPI